MPYVGRPNNNPSRMEPRSVSVEKDKPRINDERKVRPHAAGEPPMGVRPNHPGAQKEPVPPPDKLNAEYIQARDVPMATMTEAELAEWNPFARAQSGPSVEDLANKISKLEAGMARMHQDRNNMVMQIGQLMRAVNPGAPAAAPSGHPLRRQMGMSAGNSTPEPVTPPRQERGYSIPYPKPFVSNKQQWDKKTGKIGAPSASPSGPAPTTPEAPSDNTGGNFTLGPQHIQIMYSKAPEYFPPGSLDKLSPYQLGQIWNAFISKKPTKGMMNNYHKYQETHSAKMEGYPDKSFERNEPAHSSRIGDLKWKGKAHEAKPPRSNRDFMQARDISVDRVHESAAREMDDLIAQTIAKMGLAEAMSGPEADKVTLPAYWASALVNGDFSGLDDEEADQCRMMMHKLALEGWQVVDTAEDEPHYTGNYQMHNPHSQYRGGEVMDYVIHRQPQTAPQSGHTGRAAMRGPEGAAPVSETKLPRARARWV